MTIPTPSGSSLQSQRKPSWLKRPIAHQGKKENVQHHLSASGLHTVCREARCPNRSECFSHGTATFLVMGINCTRRCTFCSVGKGEPEKLDWSEIDRVVSAVRSMQLSHVVITSVTRDDLSDGGAAFFATLVETFNTKLPNVTIELLIPDLGGDHTAQTVVFNSRPTVLNHNVETVPIRYPTIRPQADYHRSLELLRRAASAGLITKSGLMVGLGETPDEIYSVLDDLNECGCRIVTIGQYLQPSPQQIDVVAFVPPDQFTAYKNHGEKRGISRVVAGPFVRSSYHATEVLGELS